MHLSSATSLLCPFSNTFCDEKVRSECSMKPKIYRSINQIDQAVWNKLVPNENPFLSLAYLRSLEENQQDMQLFYAVFCENNEAVGIACFQGVSLQTSLDLAERSKLTDGIFNVFKQIVNRKTFQLLICGNVFVTGAFGYHFMDKIPEANQLKAVSSAIDLVKKDHSFDLIMIKDLDGTTVKTAAETLSGFQQLLAQPNMELPIRKEWETFEHYLADMTSKYRKNALKNVKRGHNIVRRELSLAEIEQHNEAIYTFYYELCNKVDFNIAIANPNYFLENKKQLGDRFTILGYFIEEELVGFISLLKAGTYLDSHFIGYNEDINKANSLYPFVLLDQIRYAIDEKFELLSFGRTALEIKSSFGAEPLQQTSFGWAKSPLYHRLAPLLFERFGDELEWIQRHPFKD